MFPWSLLAPRVPLLLLQSLLLVLACTLPCRAQVPAPSAFEAAVDAARPLAAAQGLSLRTDGLWLELLRTGTPMMALRRGTRCHIGYSAFLAQRRFGELFPALPEDQAAAWLGALVRHELLHCADAVSTPSAAVADAGAAVAAASAVHRQESLADLAFALHLDSVTPEADALISRFIDLRAAAARRDPDHDTAGALRCYRVHPQRRKAPLPDASQWLQTLQVWQARCPALRAP